MAKNVAKSVRLSEEVFSLVDNRPEEGFNNKFEGMVLEFYRTEQERENKLYQLNKYIQDKEIQLQSLIARVNKITTIVHNLERVNDLVLQSLDKCVELHNM